VEDAEMFRTFNMGIGYVVIVPSPAAETAARILRGAGERVARIGEIVAGERGVELVQ
jgi:phosphoribosylformylglycinamidine cyclo-ligase